MKFGNGCWLQKEGIECFPPQEAYFVDKKEKEVTICAPTHHIMHRGDTLGGINLTVKITVPREEVIRVQVSHHLGVKKQSPEFTLYFDEEVSPYIEETEEEIQVSTGQLSLKIHKKNWSMTYARNGEVLTESSGRDLAYMRTDWTGFAYDLDPTGKAYMRQQLGFQVNEHIYGLGERFGLL